MKVVLLVVALAAAHAASPDVHQIMARVAENQAKTQDARRDFVYHQKQAVIIRRAGGRVAREEHREYEVVPADRGSQRKLLSVQGRYQRKGEYVLFDQPNGDATGVVTGIDAGLIDGFSEEMTQDHNTRDGIANDQFPLTYHQQWKYHFRFVDEETYRGRRVYRVAFDPLDRFGWKGEALIDADEYQPVFITTKMAHGLPLPIQTLLGTDVRGYGFSVSYQKFGDGVWFPVSYGGEFSVRALFFYKRTISVSLTNSDFRRVDVNSTVRYSPSEP